MNSICMALGLYGKMNMLDFNEAEWQDLNVLSVYAYRLLIWNLDCMIQP